MDCETGEIVQHQTSYFDVETGEMITNDDEIIKSHHCNGHRNRTRFTIPKSYLKQKIDSKKHDKCYLSTTQETFSLTNKKKVIELKEEIFFGYNKTSHRLFLIPTLFLFPRLAAVYILLLEIILHVWAHKQNKRNHNRRIYYRSPLHSLSSQFCSICLETKDIHRYHRKKIVITGF